MREIKFRAWNKIHNIMMKWGNLNNQYNTLNCLTYEHLEIMQYTGLKDKNDKEIYEGDITKSCEGYVRQVVWKDNSWKYYWKVKKTYQGESYLENIYNTMGETSSKRFGDEIIGNIYENPNLLKEA